MSQLEQRFLPAMEPPKRVIDTSTRYFDNYGYKSPKKFIDALSKSIDNNDVPHVVTVLGRPKSGKMHVVWDIANSVAPKFGIDPDIILWGNCFSIAKLKGKIPGEGIYGGFTKEHMNAITEEFQDLIVKVLAEKKGRSLIFIKAPAVTGAFIGERFFGVNRGITSLRNLALHEQPFDEFKYVPFWFAEVGTPYVEMQGALVRESLEGFIDQPEEIARGLENSGEMIITSHGRITRRERRELAAYIAESANPAVSEEIKLLSNNLAEEMSRKGSFRLTEGSYKWDEELEGYRFYNPDDQTFATASVLRELLESKDNFRVNTRVFLGQSNPIDLIALDLRTTLRNVALSYYPDIETIRNK